MDYQAKVTRVSGKNLGAYWPKDTIRVIDLHSTTPCASKRWMRIPC